MPEKLRVRGTDTYRTPTDNDVVYGDEIIGTDPDPAVRAEILRSAQSPGGGDGGG